METTPPAIGAETLDQVDVGPLIWHGYTVTCQICGADSRWTLVLWSLGEALTRASGLCARRHWVDHPLINPPLIETVIEAREAGLDDVALPSWEPSYASTFSGTLQHNKFPGGNAAIELWWPGRRLSDEAYQQRFSPDPHARITLTTPVVAEQSASAAAVAELILPLREEMADLREQYVQASVGEHPDWRTLDGITDRLQAVKKKIVVLAQTITEPTPDWPGGWQLQSINQRGRGRWSNPWSYAVPSTDTEHRPAWPTRAEAEEAAASYPESRFPQRAVWTPVSRVDINVLLDAETWAASVPS